MTNYIRWYRSDPSGRATVQVALSLDREPTEADWKSYRTSPLHEPPKDSRESPEFRTFQNCISKGYVHILSE